MVFPSIQFKINKHLVNLGYDFINKYGYLIAGYQFYPDSITNKLQLYFPIDILFKAINTHLFNNNIDINKLKVFANITIGSGIKFSIKKGLYLNSQSGIGLKYTYIDYNYTTNESDYAHINDYINLSLFFQIGIGYEFNLNKL